MSGMAEVVRPAYAILYVAKSILPQFSPLEFLAICCGDLLFHDYEIIITRKYGTPYQFENYNSLLAQALWQGFQR